MEITRKMADEMIFLSFVTQYQRSLGKDEVEIAVNAIHRAGLIRTLGKYVTKEEMSAYYGRWPLTIEMTIEEIIYE